MSSSFIRRTGIVRNWDLLDQRWMPRLPTWAVARNSPEGEKATAVAIEGRRTAEMRNPVGISQTLRVESRDTEMIHVDVGEKTYN